MVEEGVKKTPGGRMKLSLLAMVAFGPLLLAAGIYFLFPNWTPSATTNEGELITPLVQSITVSDRLTQNAKWVLIQPVEFDCAEDCEQMLYLSRQVVTGLGKDATRMERVLLAPEGISASFEARLARSHADVRVITRQVNLHPLRTRTATSPALFLMDPRGNIMLFYSLENAGKPMLKDLKHLLRLSTIG